MNPFMVGEIIDSAKVSRVEPSGLWHLEINGQTARLSSQYRISRAIRRVGDTVNQLIVINSNPLQVAECNYENELLNYYYDSSYSGLSPIIKNWEYWYQRWSDEYRTNSCNYSISIEYTFGNFSNLDIYLLKSTKYLLPIAGMKSVDNLEGKPIFYPASPYSKMNLTAMYHSVTKKDECSCKFPIFYNIKARDNNNNTNINFVIVLYPFIIPFKWHFGIWKHVLGLLSDTYPAEQNGQAWVDLTGLNNTEQLGNIFRQCQTKQHSSDCDHMHCIKYNLFSSVHNFNSIKTYCSKYLEEFVTCFEQATTLSIEVGQVYKDCAALNIAGTKAINGNGNIKEHFLLSGVCYKWGSDAFVHVNPVTLYRERTPTTALLGNRVTKNLFSGNIINISKK